MALEADSTLCMVSFLQLVILKWQLSELFRIREKLVLLNYGPGSSVGIVTGYGLDSPWIESRCGRDFPHLSRTALVPTQPPVQCVPRLSWGKERPGRDADPF